MNKKVKQTNKKAKVYKSTLEERHASFSPEHKKKYEEGLRNFALSELILALMEKDEVSVRKLAEIANVSPTVVQAMRSGIDKDFTLKSFFKILGGLGCKKVMVEFKGELIPLDVLGSNKR